MRLRRLILEHFRCHELFRWDEVGDFMVITGCNGRGKTSLLEAIYFLGRCRSFRTGMTRDLVQWKQGGFGISGEIQEGEGDVSRLKVVWNSSGRGLTLDGQDGVTFSEWWGRALVVAIQNTDRQLIQGGHSVRRQWADSLIASTQHEYLKRLQQAQYLVKQKASLLRHEKKDKRVWRSFTEPLRALTEEIGIGRKLLLEHLETELPSFYGGLTGGKERVGLSFISMFEKVSEWSEDMLWERECRQGRPLLGPHRDEWEILLEGKCIRSYGSEGQQKSAALAMKLAELKEVAKQTGRWPILLLDDPIKELDEGRRERFWGYLPEESQWIYATPDVGDDLRGVVRGSQVLEMEKGEEVVYGE